MTAYLTLSQFLGKRNAGARGAWSRLANAAGLAELSGIYDVPSVAMAAMLRAGYRQSIKISM